MESFVLCSRWLASFAQVRAMLRPISPPLLLCSAFLPRQHCAAEIHDGRQAGRCFSEQVVSTTHAHGSSILPVLWDSLDGPRYPLNPPPLCNGDLFTEKKYRDIRHAPRADANFFPKAEFILLPTASADARYIDGVIDIEGRVPS